MSNQQDVLVATTNEIPVSFWRHFADDETVDALQHPEIETINIQGHQKFVADVAPDFVKLMSDGYFNLPLNHVKNPRNIDDLIKIQEVDDEEDWLIKQIYLVQKQKKVIGNRKGFYNVFSPVTILKWALFDANTEEPVKGDERLVAFFIKYPEKIKHILEVIAEGVNKQVKAVVREGGADGIYYSTQELQSPKYNKTLFDTIQKTIDLTVIATIKSVSDTNILHICGFSDTTNHLEWFTDYNLSIINWSITSEGVSLKAGQNIFKDKIVLGGFSNTNKGVLYRGTKKEIEAEVGKLLTDVDRKRVIIGADCTIIRDTAIEHLKWAVDAVHQVII